VGRVLHTLSARRSHAPTSTPHAATNATRKASTIVASSQLWASEYLAGSQEWAKTVQLAAALTLTIVTPMQIRASPCSTNDLHTLIQLILQNIIVFPRTLPKGFYVIKIYYEF